MKSKLLFLFIFTLFAVGITTSHSSAQEREYHGSVGDRFGRGNFATYRMLVGGAKRYVRNVDVLEGTSRLA